LRTALFLGAAGGGIWRSTDFTNVNPTWTSLTDFVGLSGNSPIDPKTGDGVGAIDVGCITVDPTNAQTVYVGTGNDSRYGTGILKSTDGGNTFRLVTQVAPQLDPFFRRAVTQIIVDPTYPSILYASVVSAGITNAAPRAGDGIYVNKSGGVGAWTKLTSNGSNPLDHSHIADDIGSSGEKCKCLEIRGFPAVPSGLPCR
jgi:hypothetical protein